MCVSLNHTRTTFSTQAAHLKVAYIRFQLSHHINFPSIIEVEAETHVRVSTQLQKTTLF